MGRSGPRVAITQVLITTDNLSFGTPEFRSAPSRQKDSVSVTTVWESL